MNEVMLVRIGFGVGTALSAGIAAGCFRLSERNLAVVEPWPRNRFWGMVLGWAALAICVPHAEAVSPGFLLPLLWPLAVAVPVLGYFSVDYPLARSVGGLAILGGYYLIHFGFEFHTPALPLYAVLGWILGIGGIWVSGKPCSLRDWLRLCARSRRWRLVSAGYFALLALALVAAALFTDGRA